MSESRQNYLNLSKGFTEPFCLEDYVQRPAPPNSNFEIYQTHYILVSFELSLGCLGFTWDLLGRLWYANGYLWDFLEVPLAVFGTHFGALGLSLGPLESHCGPFLENH
jgi:hypothetical protein